MDFEERVCSQFLRLVRIMEKLRSPEGCPWDRKQTEKTLLNYVLEEAYEVVEAIEKEDMEALKEELGDLLLQVVFLAQIGREKGAFDIADVAEVISEKMEKRHPHVFGGEKLETAEQVLERWDSFKKEERKSLLEGIPRATPALLESFQMGARVSRVGFDWSSSREALEKVKEELGELEKALQEGDKRKIEEEIGDLLFSVVNVARLEGVNPERALKQTNRKFRERFSKIEEEAERRGKTLKEMSLEEMDEIWEWVKKLPADNKGGEGGGAGSGGPGKG